MEEKNRIFEEALSVISDGQEEVSEDKKVIFDKKTGQVSIKIPKRLALKKGINEKSVFRIVFNPKDESINDARKSNFVLYIKEVKNGKGEKNT